MCRHRSRSWEPRIKPKYDYVVLALQGGGALGAYQAGVFEGMAEAGYAPDWVAGVSIGAVNAALIAGNPPDQRVAKLRAFWDTVSSGLPANAPALFDSLHHAFNSTSAAISAMLGVPGFYAPRTPPAVLVPDGCPEALSVYDTRLLQDTLERPENLDQVMERHKDIIYSSKTRFNTTRVAELQQLRGALSRMLKELPPAFKADADVKLLRDRCKGPRVDIVHLIHRPYRYTAASKDNDFSRATGTELWAAGLDHARHSINHPELLQASKRSEGIRTFDLAP